MIIPVAVTRNGKTETVGAASVDPVGDDFAVAFYLLPGANLTTQAKEDIARELKKFARRK